MSTAEKRPLSQIRTELKIKWYRCPIEPMKLRELSKPRDSKGFAMALGHLALWSFTGILSFFLASQQLWMGFLLTLFLHGTIGTFFSAPHHELSHGTVFETKWLNGFFLRIFSTLGLLNFHIYKMSHSYHHRFTLHNAGDQGHIGQIGNLASAHAIFSSANSSPQASLSLSACRFSRY